MMFSFIALISLFQVTLVQSFYGSPRTIQFKSSSSLSFQRPISSVKVQNAIRLSGLNQLKNFGRSKRVFAASTEATNNSVETIKAIVVDVPQVIVVTAPVTPVIAKESCNWPAPVPYTQLTVGVPKEKLEGEIC